MLRAAAVAAPHFRRNKIFFSKDGRARVFLALSFFCGTANRLELSVVIQRQLRNASEGRTAAGMWGRKFSALLDLAGNTSRPKSV